MWTGGTLAAGTSWRFRAGWGGAANVNDEGALCLGAAATATAAFCFGDVSANDQPGDNTVFAEVFFPLDETGEAMDAQSKMLLSR